MNPVYEKIIKVLPATEPLRRKIFYLCYALLAGLLLLYLFFPADLVKAHIDGRFRESFPGMELHAEKGHLRFPATFVMKNISILKNGEELLFVSSMALSPQWLSIATKTPGGNVTVSLLGGTVSAVFHSTAGNPAGIQVSGTVAGIQLEKIPALDVSLSGLLSGTFRGEMSSAIPCTLEGDFSGKDIVMVFPHPLSDMDQLSFKTIQAAFSLDGDTLSIRESALRGVELSGSVTGTLRFMTPVEQTQLDLKIAVSPEEGLVRKFKTGTAPFPWNIIASTQGQALFTVTGPSDAPIFGIGAVH